MAPIGVLPSLFGISEGVIASAAGIAPTLPIPLTLLAGGGKLNKRRKSKTPKRKKNSTKRKKNSTKRKKNNTKRKRKKKNTKRVRKTLLSMRAALRRNERHDVFNL
jgi:hypothetical protein